MSEWQGRHLPGSTYTLKMRFQDLIEHIWYDLIKHPIYLIHRKIEGPRVVCKLCGHRFFSMYGPGHKDDDLTQGWDCASSIVLLERGPALYCHFGSSFDGTMYWLEPALSYDPVDPICDECVADYVDLYSIGCDDYLHPVEIVD